MGIAMTFLILVFMYLMILMIHELGHYFALRFLGFKNVRFSISDMEIGKTLHKKISLKQTLVASLSGILSGMVVTLFFAVILPTTLAVLLFMSYMIMIMWDLMTISEIVKSKDWGITLYEMNMNIFKEYKKSYKDVKSKK